MRTRAWWFVACLALVGCSGSVDDVRDTGDLAGTDDTSVALDMSTDLTPADVPADTAQVDLTYDVVLGDTPTDTPEPRMDTSGETPPDGGEPSLQFLESYSVELTLNLEGTLPDALAQAFDRLVDLALQPGNLLFDLIPLMLDAFQQELLAAGETAAGAFSEALQAAANECILQMSPPWVETVVVLPGPDLSAVRLEGTLTFDDTHAASTIASTVAWATVTLPDYAGSSTAYGLADLQQLDPPASLAPWVWQGEVADGLLLLSSAELGFPDAAFLLHVARQRVIAYLGELPEDAVALREALVPCGCIRDEMEPAAFAGVGITAEDVFEVCNQAGDLMASFWRPEPILELDDLLLPLAAIPVTAEATLHLDTNGAVVESLVDGTVTGNSGDERSIEGTWQALSAP